MKTLDVDRTKLAKMDTAENLALDIVVDALNKRRDVDDHVKIAMKTLNIIGKNRQTLTHNKGLCFAMAASIAGTPQELTRYVKATQPEIRKALSAGRSNG